MNQRQDHPFGILMYHRVASRPAGAPRPTWNVAPKRFRSQLAGLLSRGYQAWPLRRALECRAAGEPIPARVFVVTFDDGYQCVYDNAWPILRELAVPATIFLVTSAIDAKEPFACDDWSSAGSSRVPISTWRPLSAAQCAEMVDDGLIDLGSHTHSHADFRGRPDALAVDLDRSLNIMRNVFGVESPTFAFPYGYHDHELISVARRSGMSCALTTEKRSVNAGADPFRWGRLTVHEWDTVTTLSFKLNCCYAPLRHIYEWLCCPLRPLRKALVLR